MHFNFPQALGPCLLIYTWWGGILIRKASIAIALIASEASIHSLRSEAEKLARTNKAKFYLHSVSIVISKLYPSPLNSCPLPSKTCIWVDNTVLYVCVPKIPWWTYFFKAKLPGTKIGRDLQYLRYFCYLLLDTPHNVHMGRKDGSLCISVKIFWPPHHWTCFMDKFYFTGTNRNPGGPVL